MARSAKIKGWLPIFMALALISSAYGCAAVVAGGAAAGTVAGIDYTYDNIAYKTFTADYERTFRAVLAALERMGILVKDSRVTAKGSEIRATTANLEIDIDLERISPKATRVSVNAKKGPIFLKDRATATEILVQVGKILGA